MMLREILDRKEIWLTITLISLAACTILPLKIRDERLRSAVYRWILVPISLILILYAYPKGIEVFSLLATQSK